MKDCYNGRNNQIQVGYTYCCTEPYFSSAFERITGAAGPLFERISNFNMPNVISTAQASEITPTNNLQQRINIANQFELPINYSASDLQAAAKRAMTQPRLIAQL